ncbi:MAG TPA: hypothetical protein VFL93_07455 [Longimicrobiaceae bacterium]|nr:hypothetical protein [Longimicrobiaceae bacterium]
MKAPAQYVEIVGFVFSHAAGTTRIEPGATHIRFSRDVFAASGEGSQVAQHVWIHHNYFHDFASAGGNGAETIRQIIAGG